MEHLSNDQKDHPNQHENTHKLCDETGYFIINLMESQLKLRQVLGGSKYLIGCLVVQQSNLCL